ncbi:ionotropic receptor 25a-like [Schistocerca serialis cubense]|uniref:ionotropic receptor 25a-like n=1 Tax=Schistocerca serialis cubense TaxID=2023355 RepID=UPI00214DFB5F|nr:ionotropic receptor 25a-like [Schistocerca serialis cubense]
MWPLWVSVIAVQLQLASSQATSDPLLIRFLLVTEVNATWVGGELRANLSGLEARYAGLRLQLDLSAIEVDREHEVEEFQQKVCGELAVGVSALLDATWTGWRRLRDEAQHRGLPYLRLDATLANLVDAVDKYLQAREASDAALIFHTEEELDQALYHLIGNSVLRVIALNGLETETVNRLKDMRPVASYFVIFADTAHMSELYSKAAAGGLVRKAERWTLVFTDWEWRSFGRDHLNLSTALLQMKPASCCALQGDLDACRCTLRKVAPAYLRAALSAVVEALTELHSKGLEVRPVAKQCSSADAGSPSDDEGDGGGGGGVDAEDATEPPPNATGNYDAFLRAIALRGQTNSTLFFRMQAAQLTFNTPLQLRMVNRSEEIDLGNWSAEKGLQLNTQLKPAKRFFRVGTAEGVPWSFPVRDEQTGAPLVGPEGEPVWDGYCIDLLKKLAEPTHMNFDYELVPAKDNDFGSRSPSGSWTGLVGDLAMGETDMIIAPLTMTSEREEVIDFVAPYFDQSGISIVIRKPVRETSLFKFMTVLRLEVWLSIVGALTVTGIMIWLLDKYSPYSAQNNKEMYPYPCREFTLKESFWFALTSFTPQGGGEAPKALSGRTLVAAYWLFVVLMLATFTANLAAFLTVERMKSPVQSLEQLARQSRINYTVVMNSDTHEYFRNMKNAEDVLYNVWKDITLNSSSDQSKYRVWDYPIKEQYGHILQAIDQAGPVPNASVGFQKVIDQEEGKFAFIHDAAQIRYEVSKNCNLTEVGEMFAEQPYAIAVQQGSHLQEEISRQILDLQKDRYFESLTAKFWNNSAKGTCPNSDDSEGITLESLGGVFIATLFGLALAMITLAGEIFYYKRKKLTTVNVTSTSAKIPKKQVTIGKEFRPVMEKTAPRVSYISVFPRNQLY